MREVLASLGVRVSGAHRAADPLAALGRADAVFVGGSDSFRLLRAVQRNGMLVAIGDRGRAEMPYVGVSAGANLACPTIRTTNDIPIAQPASLTALGLIPFQLNPHYPAVGMDGGQTRQARDRRLDGVPEHGSGLRHHRGCPGFVHAPSLADHWLERVSSGRR